MKKVVAVLLSASLVTACASMNNKQVGTIAGAGIGGAAGGLISKEHPVIGILIGAAAGAIAGLAIGHCLDKRVRGADETVKIYKYDPSQGTMVKIEDVRIEPQMVRPGEPAKLIIDYAVLEGNAETDIEVTEKRVIKTGNTALKEIGPTRKTRKPGTYSTEQDVVFPSSLSEGTYQLRGEVLANGKMSTKETAFEIAEAFNGLEGNAFQGSGALPETRGFAH